MFSLMCDNEDCADAGEPVALLADYLRPQDNHKIFRIHESDSL